MEWPIDSLEHRRSTNVMSRFRHQPWVTDDNLRAVHELCEGGMDHNINTKREHTNLKFSMYHDCFRLYIYTGAHEKNHELF